tara:strand:- start:1576 stop:1971 length:396 start_codon:yes stop_codon:yes gene_type:complete
MINKVILLGRVGVDPEVKISTKETKFAQLSLATSEKFKNKAGEWKEKTQWHKVIVFDPRVAETIEKYVKKGTILYIEGQIETRKYEHNGETKYATEIVLPQFKGVLKMVGNKPKAEASIKETIDDVGDIPF